MLQIYINTWFTDQTLASCSTLQFIYRWQLTQNASSPDAPLSTYHWIIAFKFNQAWRSRTQGYGYAPFRLSKDPRYNTGSLVWVSIRLYGYCPLGVSVHLGTYLVLGQMLALRVLILARPQVRPMGSNIWRTLGFEIG